MRRNVKWLIARLSSKVNARERMKTVRLQQPYPEEEDDVIGANLFENKFIEKSTRALHTFWKIREKKMKEKEENEKPSQ